MSTPSDQHNTLSAGKCPFHQGNSNQTAGGGTSSRDWWPNQLRVELLAQHSNRTNPLGDDFNYRKAFSELDYAFSSAWRGTARAPTAPLTGAAARAAGSSVLRRSTPGRIT